MDTFVVDLTKVTPPRINSYLSWTSKKKREISTSLMVEFNVCKDENRQLSQITILPLLFNYQDVPHKETSNVTLHEKLGSLFLLEKNFCSYWFNLTYEAVFGLGWIESKTKVVEDSNSFASAKWREKKREKLVVGRLEERVRYGRWGREREMLIDPIKYGRS